MIFLLLILTAAAFGSFSYCELSVSPATPPLAAPLFLALTLLLGMAALIALRDATAPKRGKWKVGR